MRTASLCLLDCSRGTSDTECAHKQIITAYGSWVAGVELSDTLLREWRHRYNHRIAERRRLGFPKIGHYDTWRIDKLQLLVEHNHGIDIYPGWSNTNNFAPTPETFGTVPLHSAELGAAMACIEVTREMKANLSSDQRYLCEAMGTPLPLLPIHGKQEHTLFSKLALEQLKGKKNVAIDFDALAIEWCAYVNGASIFPKLPVYLNQHFTSWQCNQRIKDTLRAAQPLIDALLATFARDVEVRGALLNPEPTLAGATPTAPATGTSPTPVPTPAAPAPAAPAPAAPAPVPVPVWVCVVCPPVLQHAPMQQAPAEMAAAQEGAASFVAGINIGGSAAAPGRYVQGRKRGKDKKLPGVQRTRTCRMCGDTESCPGRFGGAHNCTEFDV
jgi:hypothetical protein